MPDKIILTEAVASWNIAVDQVWIQYFIKGYLVIGCLRYFGGDHSETYGARVEILLNEKHVDGFGLMITPENHTDYFHRIPLLDLPRIWPLSGCQTLYAWPIHNEILKTHGDQKVTVHIDKDINRDIDYVAITCFAEKLPQKVFLSHSWNDKKIARQIAKDLNAKGIGVWIDEVEMKLGDSLLDKISNAIDSIDFVVALLSKASVKSPWIKTELDIAMHQEVEGKHVKAIPILLDDCELPVFLKHKLRGDLRSISDYTKVIREIEESIRK